MRGLTLYQPWASLVASGAKRLETRSWGTAYRGPLLIHAGLQKPPRSHYSHYTADLDTGVLDATTVEEMILGLGVSDFDALPRGGVVAVADLTRCDQISVEKDVHEAIFRAHGVGLAASRREFLCGDFSLGRWMWLLWDVRPLPRPLSWIGQRGLWRADDRLIAQVREVLPAWQS